ncbi:MAG: Hpt domain-containing protein [Terracidiphilus sp.]|jgi:HPt (histidine-containing phosphotransfer) domain-containing protein
MTGPIAQTALAAALDRMWVQFLPQIEERVAILETAAQAFAANQLSIEQHQAANAAAHKLAGVLGTFGLSRGTALARELEIMYSRENGPDPALGPRLASIAAELRTIVAARE